MRWILFCLSILIVGLGADPLQVNVTAKSAILMNAKSGAVLYEKEAHAPMFPASTTKIATALFLLDEKQLDMGQIVKVSAGALKRKANGTLDPPHAITSDSSLMGLMRGDRFNIEDLLHGLMLSSGNDAANVLAETVSGSVSLFVEELNAYLQKMGCVKTRFVNPHGYHHPEQVSTAYELCQLTRKALMIPKFREIVGKQAYRTSQKPELELQQTNRLMRPGEHYYPKAIGVKTGFHSQAQNNLVAAAQEEDRTLIAVVLGCPKSDDRYRDAKALFEEAFKEQKVENVLVTPGQIYKKNVEGAKSVLTASLKTALKISFYPSEMPKVKGFVYWDALSLPIQAGQRVGEIKLLDETGEELGRQELFAREKVSPTFFFTIKRFWTKLW